MEQIEVIVGKGVFHQKYLSVALTEKWEQKKDYILFSTFLIIVSLYYTF